MNLPFISIIVPCYNQAIFLDECLSSVLNQTFNNWECIIIDDGSVDNTYEIANNWSIKDSRFSYIKKKNGGLSSARNAGLKIAKGDFIQFLDSDDYIHGEKLKLQIEDLRLHDISISDYMPFRDGSNEFVESRYLSPFLSEIDFKSEIISEWENKKSIPCHSPLFRRKIVIDNQLTFDVNLKNHEDWFFWVKLFYFSNSIKNNNRVLAYYRIRSNGMSQEFKTMNKGFKIASEKVIKFFQREKNDNLKKVAIKKNLEIQKRNKFNFKKIFKKVIKKIQSYF